MNQVIKKEQETDAEIIELCRQNPGAVDPLLKIMKDHGLMEMLSAFYNLSDDKRQILIAQLQEQGHSKLATIFEGLRGLSA